MILPAAMGGICTLLRPAKAILIFIAAAATLCSVAAGAAAWLVFTAGPMSAGAGWLYLDELSAYHIILLHVVFLLSSVYAYFYFSRDHSAGTARLRRFGSLWLGSLAAMSAVLVSNNLGIVWVGIEASTLLTAFLICTHVTPASLEATWKYLIMCSVGVAFAFIGTLLVAAAAAAPAKLEASDVLLWTHLRQVAGSLNPAILKTAFIFLLVGYGTKMGLAPMHNWLPDAHSQAPAPVSAIFSGFLLNTALYCILRYVPLVEKSTGGSGWALEMLTVLGLISIVIAGAFIIFQRDAKRLLAYSTVEHMGIIALGVGLGGFGTFAAMFHVMNHSICKSLGFFSAGRLGQIYGTHDLQTLAGSARTSPIWGRGFLLSLLALIGVAPFAIFMSEFQIVKAAVDKGSFVAMAIFLFGAAIVFVGVLRHAISASYGDQVARPETENTGLIEKLLVIVPLAVLLALGLWMPDFLKDAIARAAGIIGGSW